MAGIPEPRLNLIESAFVAPFPIHLAEEAKMPYELKPLSCDPAKLTGLSEKLIVSHWENNYGGAVKRLGARTAIQPAEIGQ